MSAKRVAIADCPDHQIAGIVGRVGGAGPMVKPWRMPGGYEFILDDGSGAALDPGVVNADGVD